MSVTATTRDGTRIQLRPLADGDEGAITAVFDRLGERSRYQRFLRILDHLAPRELAYLSHVDHRSHEALLALDPENRKPIGIARYVRLRDQVDVAEVAVSVVDEWQERGVGTALVKELAERARADGIRAFRATCLACNRDILDVLHGLGSVTVLTHGAGTVEVEIDLLEGTEPALETVVRHAALSSSPRSSTPRP